MDFKSEIAGLCLYGLIKNNSQKDRAQCLRAIKRFYGPQVAEIVTRHLKD